MYTTHDEDNFFSCQFDEGGKSIRDACSRLARCLRRFAKQIPC